MTRRAANPGQRPFMVSGDSMKRIAAAVQSYEHGNRSQSPVKFRSSSGDDGDGLKYCRVPVTWPYDTSLTLEVWHAGEPPDEESSGETVDAWNTIATVAAGAFVLVGRAENGSWYLIEIGRECESGHRAARLTEADLEDSRESAPLETGDGPQVLIHDEGCLKWASLKKITVLTGATLTEAGLEFEQTEVWTFTDANSTVGPAIITTTDCQPPE